MSQDSDSSIVDATGDASVAEPLQGGVTDVWKDTLPSGIHSKLVLETKQFVLAIPEEQTVFLQAGGRWGPAKGNVALYVRRPQKVPLSFALVASLSSLDSSEIFEDAQLASEVKSQLPGPVGDVCVFREWPGIGEAKAHELAVSQPNSSHALNVINHVGTLLCPTPSSKKTGILVTVKLNLSDWSSSPAATLLKRLTDIDHLTGTSAITTLVLDCSVAKSSDPKPLTSFTFLATVNAFPVLDNTLLKDISLSLTVTRSDSTLPPNANLKLTGQLVLGVFNAQNPWTSVGTLTIDKAKSVAELVVAPANQEQSMAELGAIKLGNINLRVSYTFGQPEVKWDASLFADVKVGSHSARGAVVFKGSRPSHLLFRIGGTLQVGELFRAIITSSLPKDFVELSLTDIDFCYSWNAEKLLMSPKPDIQPGFTGSARTDVFGLKFDAFVRFSPSGKDKGIFVSAKLEQPVDLYIVSLYEKYNMCAGPKITYVAKDSEAKGVTIDGGLSLIGMHFEDTKIRYGERSIKDKQPCLQVDINLKVPVVKGGSATVNLEFYKVKDRMHFRLNGLPLREILDAFDDAKLFSKIRDLTKADPCKEINIPVKDVITTEFWPKIEFSEKQPEQEAGKMPRCSFDVSCTWSIKLAKEKVVQIDLEPFPLIINVPKQWEDLWKEIRTALSSSLERIAQTLLNNVEKFSEILAFYAARYMAEKWMKEALRAWLCRHSNAPVPKPEPEPVPVPVTPAPAPPPQPIKTKKNKNGDEVTLTDKFQELILKLRTEAPNIIDCLEIILQMLGEGDPTKVRPNIPEIPVPSGDKPKYIKYTKLLLETFKSIRDRDWNSTTWDDDYKLIKTPFGPEWNMDLWNGLHDIHIQLGLHAKAFVPVYHLKIFFARNESTWPKNGQPDPRPEVEVFRKIDNLTSELVDLDRQANDINESQRETTWRVIDFFTGLLGFGRGTPGGGPKAPIKVK